MLFHGLLLTLFLFSVYSFHTPKLSDSATYLRADLCQSVTLLAVAVH